MKVGIHGTGERKLISEGPHTLTLTGCDLKEITNKFAATEGAKTQKLLWKFVSATREEYAVWTNLDYGSPRASLTSLLNMLVPGITAARAAELDTDDLIDDQFRCRIVHKTHETTGKIYAQHTYLEPIERNAEAPATTVATPATTASTAVTPAVPQAAPAVLGDPFADDES